MIEPTLSTTGLDRDDSQGSQTRHRAIMDALIDASEKTERFEKGIAKIKRQVWPSWFIGIGTIMFSLIAMLGADLCSTFFGQIVARTILIPLTMFVIAEFVAATISVRAIMYELDR